MQYEQLEDGQRLNLPKPSIDTGMGLERITAVLQGKSTNYEIDLLRGIIENIAGLTGQDPDGENAASHKIIADHLRSVAFLIADGVCLPMKVAAMWCAVSCVGRCDMRIFLAQKSQ